MLEAGIFTRFLDHPGFIIWLILFVLFQRSLYYRTNVPGGLTLLIAGGFAALVLRIMSHEWFASFITFFPGMTQR
jgi:hypothetical protein